MTFIRKQRTHVFVALLSLSLLTACSSKSKEAGARADSKEEPAPAIEVKTAPVTERRTNRSVEVVGSLVAEDEVTVSSQASGNLADITVDLGTAVRSGQVIARIDQRELKFKVDQAEGTLHQAEARLGVKRGERIDPQKQPDVRMAFAALERARYDLKASRSLAESGDISKQQLDVYQKTVDQAEARYQAALENVRNLEAIVEEKRAALDLAKKQLTDTEIVSPISGVVKEKAASRGEYLQPGKPIVTIVQVDPVRLRADIPEYAAASVRTGQTMTLTVESFPGRTFTGRVVRIGPSLNEQTRALTVEAEVRNPGNLLRPGMFAKSNLVTANDALALMAPRRAVQVIAGLNKLFVVENGRVSERIVKLGAVDGDLIEIVEGVKSGEVVATSNLDKLQEGSAVSAGK
jgi:multidrug efflux pump subunit AcrA (membrane-fusion protein)